jgi:hypothetical protein
MSRRGKGIVLALALVVASVFAASAFASGNGTLCHVYCKKGASVQNQVNAASAFTPPSSDGSGTLPFTGLDLAVVALGGVLLVIAGFGLHRVTRKPPEPPAV